MPIQFLNPISQRLKEEEIETGDLEQVYRLAVLSYICQMRGALANAQLLFILFWVRSSLCSCSLVMICEHVC
jgi:hypothetical protein